MQLGDGDGSDPLFQRFTEITSLLSFKILMVGQNFQRWFLEDAESTISLDCQRSSNCPANPGNFPSNSLPPSWPLSQPSLHTEHGWNPDSSICNESLSAGQLDEYSELDWDGARDRKELEPLEHDGAHRIALYVPNMADPSGPQTSPHECHQRRIFAYLFI